MTDQQPHPNTRDEDSEDDESWSTLAAPCCCTWEEPTCGHGPGHVVYADQDGVLTRADLDESRRERLARERRNGYAERTKDGAAVEVGDVLGLGAPRQGFVVARIGPLSSPLCPGRVAYSADGTGWTLLDGCPVWVRHYPTP